MPLVFGLIETVPAGAAPMAGPVTAGVTLAVTLMIILRATGVMRLWGPVIGILSGCAVAGFFDLFSWEQLAAAQWIGLPVSGWPGVRLQPSVPSSGPCFRPSSWSPWSARSRPSATRWPFSAFRGATAAPRTSARCRGRSRADGLGNFLSGLMATVPNTTYSSSVSIVEITGVAARRVGVCIGAAFCVLAFLPKVVALLLSIPDAVIGAYAVVLIAILFVLGMRIVVGDGMDYRKAAIVGVSFWVGSGFQSGGLFTSQMSPFFAEMMGNGMTSGGLTALVLSAFVEITGARRRRLVTMLSVDALPRIRKFLTGFVLREGWREDMAGRVSLAAEEALLSLLGDEGEEAGAARRLRLSVRTSQGGAELEFVAASGEGNIEDRIALASELSVELHGEHDFSLRLLRHLATTVRHQKYHDTDILTLQVDPPAAE